MDGAIALSQNATKLMWANVQLTPDPTILSRETGTRHRTAERVSKQTDALVVSISERREVVTLFAGGAKYVLQEIPAVLAKANQALATLDKYRARFDQVSMRLTALEFEGGVTLHDALTVLQRSEMVTRMAVEIERYIVELGAEGRLIEMQLEEMLTGVAADRSALVKDYIVDHSEEAFAAVMESLPAAAEPGPARLRAPRRADGLRPQAQHPRLSGHPARLPHPRAASPACPRWSVESVVREFGSFDVMLAATGGRAGGRRGRRRAAREGDPRGPSPAAGDQSCRPLPADVGQQLRHAKRAEQQNQRRTPFRRSNIERRTAQ